VAPRLVGSKYNRNPNESKFWKRGPTRAAGVRDTGGRQKGTKKKTFFGNGGDQIERKPKNKKKEEKEKKGRETGVQKLGSGKSDWFAEQTVLKRGREG